MWVPGHTETKRKEWAKSTVEKGEVEGKEWRGGKWQEKWDG